MLGAGPVVVGEPEQPAAPAVMAAQQSTIPKRWRLLWLPEAIATALAKMAPSVIFIVITRSSPSPCAPPRVPVGSTCDVEYQAENEGNLDLEVYVPAFQALNMQPFTLIPTQ
jgi:hypothetical protein